MLLLVIVQCAGPAEARYATTLTTENNELESATAMIEFRSTLQRISYGPHDLSLTLLTTTLPTNNNNNNNNKDIEQQVHGLHFHAVQHPLLCDQELSQDSRLNNVKIVSSSQDNDENSAGVLGNEMNPIVDNHKYVCAVWPVKTSAASQLEWLSANGIERRARKGVETADADLDTTWSTTTEGELQYLVMHLGDANVMR